MFFILFMLLLNVVKYELRYSWWYVICCVSLLLLKRVMVVLMKLVVGDDVLIFVFWLVDLLLEKCLYLRVLIFGYDFKIIKYIVGVMNKGSLFVYSRDFLFLLCRDWVCYCFIIFVVYSFGGIIVKEVGDEVFFCFGGVF